MLMMGQVCEPSKDNTDTSKKQKGRGCEVGVVGVVWVRVVMCGVVVCARWVNGYFLSCVRLVNKGNL